MKHLVAKIYILMDKGPLRALSLITALVLAGCIFWQPARFAAATSRFEIWHGLLIIWSVCAGVIHGSGFQLRTARWQGIFCPLPAQIILIIGLLIFFIEK